MCKEETKLSVGEQFMHKQKKKEKSHVYNVETILKPHVHLLGDMFPKIINSLHTNNSSSPALLSSWET